MATPTAETFLTRARELHETIRTLRRTIHRRPELAFQEFETAARHPDDQVRADAERALQHLRQLGGR